MDFDFDIDFDFEKKEGDERPPKEMAKHSHRRVHAIYELSPQLEYRRAWGEVKLLELMKYEQLEIGKCYNILTGGEIDQISFLKIALNKCSLDHVIISTWVISSEDFLKLKEYVQDGRIKKLDLYLGEIFKNQYKIEYAAVKDFYTQNPDVGRYALFRNHAKVIAACNEEEGFYVGIQCSANCNMNPRNEQACIIVDRGIYHFYKNWYDGIKSFENE